MSAIRHVMFVVSGYPSKPTPNRHVFVQQFVHAVARQGVRCTVIQPVPMHHAWRWRLPYRADEPVADASPVCVLRPWYASFSARPGFARLGALNPSLWTFLGFAAAARGAVVACGAQPDAICGHFLYLAGAAAVRVGRALKIPSFPCAGESDFWTVEPFGTRRAKADLAAATGIVSNSPALKQAIIRRLGLPPERIGVFPNGIDRTRFFPRNKRQARARLALPQDKLLTAFVGSYCARKGANRVAQAIAGLSGVAGAFAGEGRVPPVGANVVFSRPVPHPEMAEFLSAADVFVLPTKAEGCCNAILEAMACGLPVVSSTGDFNDAILDESMSLRVDPMDVAALRAAIARLAEDRALRRQMADAALERAGQFDINSRARRVLEFMAARSAPRGARKP